MKKLFLISIAAIFALSSCKNNKEFSISGKIENAGDIKKVVLYEADQAIDSAFLNEKSEFKFKRVSPEPNFYNLLIGDKAFLLVAKNGDELEFKTNYADSSNTYEVKGSEESEKIRAFNKISNDHGKINEQIQEEYARAISKTPAAKDSIYNLFMPKIQTNMNAYSNAALKFADENKDNLAGFYAVATLDPLKYEAELIKYAEDINSKYPNNKAVKEFAAKMMNAKPVSVGQMAPQFELPTPDGKLVKLSDFKGKYVLLDFWASWCGPCREENPNVLKVFNAYKDKGFTVLAVSLDDDKNAWLKAVKDDNLMWTHVSELKRWEGKVASLYQVTGIPASFVLDPSGKIVAKNLRGAELENFLSKTIK